MNGCIIYVLLIEKVLEDGRLLGHLIDASFPFLQILLFYVHVSVDPVFTILSVRKGRVFLRPLTVPMVQQSKVKPRKGLPSPAQPPLVRVKQGKMFRRYM